MPMPISLVSTTTPPAQIERFSADAYSSRARKRLTALLRLKMLELRAERLEYVQCVITQRLDRGFLLTGVPSRGEALETRLHRTTPCQRAL